MPRGPRSRRGGARVAFSAPKRFDHLAQLIKRDTDALATLMARECGKVVTECRAEVVEGLHMVQYVFGTGRMPVGDVRRQRDRGEGRLHAAQAVGRGRGHHAVELPVRGAAVDARAEPARRQHRRLQADRGHARRSASGWSSCSSKPGFPAGTVNLVHGDGAVGEALVRNPGVNVVLFTGSYESGKRIQEVSAELPDRIVAAEMGSKSAVIVCDDARLDLAVNAGICQRVQDERPAVRLGGPHPRSRVADRPLREGVRGARRSGCGSATRSTRRNFTGPVINRRRVEKVLSYNALAKAGGRGGAARRRPDEPATRRAASCRRSSTASSAKPGRARASARRCSARTSR